MSNTNVVKLSPAQLQANRTAIHGFIASATAKYGRGSVILLPQFEESATGAWSPVQSNGIRPTSNNSAFMRFGKMTINSSTGKMQYLYTNHFGESEGELVNKMLFVDPSATVGTAVRGIRLVIHESLTPFSRTKPDRDIKWADQANGIACVKYVADDQGVVREQPIYRTSKVFWADDEGNYPPAAVNQLIAHDNGQQLSEAAFLKFSQQNKANSPAIAGAAPVSGQLTPEQMDARVDELEAIPEATRTRAQKKELKELLAQLV